MIENRMIYLRKRKTSKFPTGAEMLIPTSKNSKHRPRNQEALDLDPFSSQLLNEEDGEEIPGDIARDSDDQIPDRVLHEHIVMRFAG